MNRKERCDQLIEDYYAELLRYCRRLLNGDLSGAEECTHEVFLRLLKKQNSLDLYSNIRGWLYAAADRVVKEYMRENTKMQAMLQYDLTQIPDDAAEEKILSERVCACLSDQEQQLLLAYYSEKNGSRIAVAAQYGMTPVQMYRRVHRLREKVRAHLERMKGDFHDKR